MSRLFRTMLPLGSALAMICAVPAVAKPMAPASAVQWVRANGATLRYELSGSGPDTVVLLHELGTSLDTWDYVVPTLRRGHRVLRYDLRGFGLSSRIAGNLTMADEMADLDALLAALDIRGKVTLVGGAVGGAIALNYAAEHPERVRGVVAISPAAYLQARIPAGPPPQGGGAAAAPGAPGAPGTPAPQGAAPGGGMPAVTSPEQLAEASYPARFRAADPARYERFLALTGGGGDGGRITSTAAYRVSFSEVLPRITCPVLIVGTSLWIRPSSAFRELAQAVPGGRFVDLETGHFAAMASPELVTPVITRFLAETR